eukprot:jgi/Astpho2/7144/Aster-01470
MLVYVPPHPLVKHWLAVARNKMSPPPIFRAALAELGRILIYEAARDWLPTLDTEVESPVGPADATYVNPMKPVKLVPILRAGLVLLEQTSTLLPAQQTYHVGLASAYLNKLPERFESDDKILISDPMLATGGTVLQVLEDIVARGGQPQNIIVISVVAAPPALQKLSKFSGLKVYTAQIDAELNEKGYIVPGLGDAGDRVYGT